jgi:hypothetical protein
MTTNAFSIDGLIIRTRHHEGQQLLHCCLASAVRAIDIKEGSWNATMFGMENHVSGNVSVYGEGTTTYDDGSGRRVVIIAGELVDEDDKAGKVLKAARNEFLFSASASLKLPASPFWLTNRHEASKLHRQSIMLHSRIGRIAETCDFVAHLKFQQWFYEMHDKMMPLKGESYSDIWKSELNVAKSIDIQPGLWLPAQFDGTPCVLHVDATCRVVIKATAYYLAQEEGSLKEGSILSRSVRWDDTNEGVQSA